MTDAPIRFGDIRVVHLPDGGLKIWRSVGFEIPVVSGSEYVGLVWHDIDRELLTPERDPDRSRARAELLRALQKHNVDCGRLFSGAELERAAALAAAWINGEAEGGPIITVSVDD